MATHHTKQVVPVLRQVLPGKSVWRHGGLAVFATGAQGNGASAAAQPHGNSRGQKKNKDEGELVAGCI